MLLYGSYCNNVMTGMRSRGSQGIVKNMEYMTMVTTLSIFESGLLRFLYIHPSRCYGDVQ